MSSERWGVGRDVACSVRREDKSYNPTNLAKFYSKPLAGLAGFAWVKNFGRCTQRPYFLTAHLPVFLSCWTCFSICPRWCSRNGSLWDPETSSGWHLCTHRSLLTSHLSSLTSHCSSPICQKTRKGDFGVRKKNVKDFNILIIKWIQIKEITPENTRKKDLSVFGVLLKSFCGNT